MATPQYSISCPRCAHRLVHVTSKSDAVHIYICPEHGEYVLVHENGESLLSYVRRREHYGEANAPRH